MAMFDSLPEEERTAIAGKIGEWIATTPKFADKRQGKLELAESFQVWMLRLDRITQADRPMIQLASDTKRWHHQIRIDGKAEAFVRTIQRQKPQPGWKMMRLSASQLAQSIDKAIDWIDQNVAGDCLVRFLEIPAYQTETFWLQKNEQESFVLLVHASKAADDLLYEHLYPAAEFLEILSQKPAVGGALIHEPDA